MHQRRGRNERIPQRTGIWDMQPRAASRNRQIHGQYAARKSREYAALEPDPEQRPLFRIATLCQQDANFQLLKGDRGQEQIHRVDAVRP